MENTKLPTVRAYAFLFDGSIEGLPDPQLPFFTAAVLTALSQADPQGRSRTQVRVGLPTITVFAERTTAVRGTSSGSGRTVSHDKEVYKYVVWDWLDSLGEDWSSIDRELGQKIFLRHTGECIALSMLYDDIRDNIDVSLKTVPGYVGGFAIDPGNPIHRGGFFENLIHAAAIVDGSVVQERSFEGDEDWPLEGAAQFKPAGLVWKDYGWLAMEGPSGLPRGDFSQRGAKAATNVARKQALSVEGRVIEAIERTFFLNASRKTFEFEAVGEPSDVLQAIMPQGKFTNYLFDREHKDGRSKAAFLIKELGIDPEDWRYLAAQFYYGLLIAKPDTVQLKEWETGYGIRFDVQMRVRGRSGRSAVMVTGWNMNPSALPSLSTAYPAERDADAVEPGDPPVLPPGPRTDADWVQLWTWAKAAGEHAGEAVVPTPMYLVGYEPIPEGEFGTASVRVHDARRGLARWLARQGLGHSDGYGGTVVFSPLPSPSLERATAWAREVALTFRLNGINAEVDTFSN